MITIRLLEIQRLSEFISYLHSHISENGRSGESLYFPLSAEQSILSKEMIEKFSVDIHTKIGEEGWRMVWIAIDKNDHIVGHIDIRPYTKLNTEHRVLLGMGVDIKSRRMQVGQSLLEFVINYCKACDTISWLDLEVMTNNTPAKRLYKKCGFEQLSETTDMFRIDGRSYSYTSMTLDVSSRL